MGDPNSEEEERKRAAEERQRKINEINGKINALKDEQNSLNSLLEKFRSQKSQLDSYVESWRTLFASDMANTDLIQENVFDGTLATRVTREYSSAISKMKENIRLVDVVKGDVGGQILNLETRVNNIGTEISNLYGELSRI